MSGAPSLERFNEGPIGKYTITSPQRQRAQPGEIAGLWVRYSPFLYAAKRSIYLSPLLDRRSTYP
jgi:hypothetical protein